MQVTYSSGTNRVVRSETIIVGQVPAFAGRDSATCRRVKACDTHALQLPPERGEGISACAGMTNCKYSGLVQSFPNLKTLLAEFLAGPPAITVARTRVNDAVFTPSLANRQTFLVLLVFFLTGDIQAA